MAQKKLDVHTPRYKEVRASLKQVVGAIRGKVEEVFSRHVEEDPFTTLYSEEKLLMPPYAFDRLYTIYEESDILQSCVEAMQLNIDGFGYELTFLGDDVKERKTPEAIAQRVRMENFFDYANDEQSWMTVSKAAREDLEVLGNSALEVVRNRRGEIQMTFQLPFKKLRIAALEGRAVSVERTIPRDGKEVKVKVRRYFRRFAQVLTTGRKVRWFKSFGDPRSMDAVDGVFKPAKSCKILASEILFFKHPFGGMPYGMPRWIGAVLDVMGRRNAQYVNFDLFNSQGIPPLAVLVSGGVLTDESIEELESMIRSMRGVEKWNRIMLLESNVETVGLEEKGTARIELKNLAEYRKEDQMFDKYLAQTEKTSRHRFRLPPLYTGGAESFCVSEDTETLTENGWKMFWQVEEGEKIATIHPETHELEFHNPVGGVYVFDHDGPMFHFENKGVDMLVTPNHKMYIKLRRGDYPWYKKEAREIFTTDNPNHRVLFMVSPSGVPATENAAETLALQKWRRRMTEPEEAEDRLIDMDLMLKFVGLYIEDGSAVTRPGQWGLVLYAKKERKRKLFQEVCDSLGQYDCIRTSCCSKAAGGQSFAVSDRGLWQWVTSKCGMSAATKHIPAEFMSLDNGQTELLLAGLIATDGNVETGKQHPDGFKLPRTCRFVTTSLQLAGQVQLLAFKCGYRAVLGEGYDVRPNRLPVFYVKLKKASDVQIHNFQHEIVPYKGRVYCFEVPNHLFVTRRNGKIGIHGNTHATARAAQNVAEEQVFVPERKDSDEVVNSRIVRPELKVTLWKYKSKGPQVVGSEEIAKGIEVFSKAGALTVNHAVALANRAFGIEMSKFTEPWADYPIVLVLKMIEAGAQMKNVPFTAAPTLPAPVNQRQAAIPGLPAKVFKSDMFNKEERSLYKRLIFLQDAIDRGLDQEEIAEEDLKEAL